MSAGPSIQDIMGGQQFNPMPGQGLPGAMDQFPGGQQGPGMEGLPPDMLQAVLDLLQQVFIAAARQWRGRAGVRSRLRLGRSRAHREVGGGY